MFDCEENGKIVGEMLLSKEVKEKLQEALIVWADEVLAGRPSILFNDVYSNVEHALLEEQLKIERAFPKDKKHE